MMMGSDGGEVKFVSSWRAEGNSYRPEEKVGVLFWMCGGEYRICYVSGGRSRNRDLSEKLQQNERSPEWRHSYCMYAQPLERRKLMWRNVVSNVRR